MPIGLILPNGYSERSLIQAVEVYNTNNGTTIKLERGQTLNLFTILPIFFDEYINKIIEHINSLLIKPKLLNVKFLFLVGGFAESPLLRRRIEDEYGTRLRVIVPPSPGIVVMNGAVQFGFDPNVITERIMPQTIGIECAVLWDETKHTGKLQVLDKGQRYCA